MQRRLAFGTVAELYDRVRPSYPDALADDVLVAAGVRPALEIGAGTGKATVMFAARGVPVRALEPSPEMAAIARRNCARWSGVKIEEAEFERWEPGGERFGLAFSAQAFHWVPAHVRYAKSRSVLADDGVLAVFWNVVRWSDCELREALREVYRRAAPGFEPAGPMHPEVQPEQLRPWARDGAPGFEPPKLHRYEWSCDYSAEGYVQLLSTHSDHLVLPERIRTRLLAAVGEAIAAGGGSLRMPYLTELWMTRATRARSIRARW